MINKKLFKKIIHVAEWLRCDELKVAGPIILVIINSSIVVCGLLAAIISNWDVLEVRFLAIKDIVLVISLTMVGLEYAFSNKKIMSLIEIIDGKFLYERLHGSMHSKSDEIKLGAKNINIEICEVIEKAWHSIEDLDRIIMNSVRIVTLFLDLTPFFINILIILNTGIEKITIKDLKLPFFFLYPKGYDKITVYLVMYAIDSLFIYFIYVLAYCALATVTIGAQKTATDLELFRMCLKCFTNDDGDSLWPNSNGNQMKRSKICGIRIDKNDNNQTSDEDIEYLAIVITYHQMICRQVRVLESNGGLVTTLANFCIGLQTSVCLFLFQETNNVIMKTACAFMLFFNGLLLFFYCSSGQKIIDENELLRKQLAKVVWWNKPRKFQTSLLLIMTRANHDLYVKPYGIYVLNYNVFRNVLNASYSYLNMIRALK
ncbi:hypothetical protein LSTR_LSTR009601 [Laodelphax striatellus]|uniref:Odorant receptor n=1 Tax=Laodelphax striatellus TaxID=195883 RepID=A0A482X1I0_LAOST|nr:hypothetical protein LSTR_LSTR009601 [Laodelphax striatellus]